MAESTNVNRRAATHQYSIVGWTCGFCGCYVSYDLEHWCYQAKINQYQPQYLPQWNPTPIQVTYPDPMLTEIRDLLKQLIELLEGK